MKKPKKAGAVKAWGLKNPITGELVHACCANEDEIKLWYPYCVSEGYVTVRVIIREVE